MTLEDGIRRVESIYTKRLQKPVLCTKPLKTNFFQDKRKALHEHNLI
jgi:hypothetical protein